jgi:hypothetical protein
MDVRVDNEPMILFILILTAVVAGLVTRLLTDGDHADRDSRGWWPGSSR